MKTPAFNPLHPFSCLEAIKAARTGNYTLLDARLAACLAGLSTISMDELEFIREYGYVPVERKRGPRKKHPVNANQESLEVARVFIVASKGYRRGFIGSGWAAAIDACGSRNTVKKHLRRAKKFGGGEWFKSQCKRVRKGKPIQ
jgi:hypothetical protein